MKASFITAYGGKEVIAYGDRPDPVIDENGILISVRSASVNPIDYKIKSGAIRIVSPSKFPRILGNDFSGVVEKTGSLVTGFETGDRVYGAALIFRGKPGSMAELMSTDPKKVRKMPSWLSFTDAASLPVAALTALNGLRNAGTGKGTKLFVNGATGGVGHFAVQIAKAKGAHVTASCSTANADFARSLGADTVTGYSERELRSLDGEFDAILDAYGKMSFRVAAGLLRKGGIYASPLFMPYSVPAAWFFRILSGSTFTSSNMRDLPQDYAELEKMLEEKTVKPYIDRVFALKDAAEAFEYTEKGRPKGKVIVNVRD
jgi:NADPH:quinone reductase-like Zn-dependent oxidoreductase